ncbi:LacI family DNA-binding transcriptional regulator [Pseudomonas typographi]|uniref:LacI family transcriptional regulator n=1 Tax=Pseudomonas typographi TaxID=2715964 RepID=A0ABR7Z9I3_9PSED|nr:LacI family DNA-binding transcriptional regulator [Pseudomonas typographi]MBD1551098.1 LacI family transcriptional regulator [Pseudomonas typographi]MBD1586408.1 LacI family transcriptional regulator [Pseudomonas typographi]MBD1602225.1 LacI family transcriptional regulator [Pseudomonas typographi]
MDTDKQKAGLAQVADLAGVSLSTVDRVLNERGSVSDSKRRKVLSAARSLGLRRLLPSPVHGLLRFDLLLVESSTEHYKRLVDAFSRQAQLHRTRLVIQSQRWHEQYPQQLLDFIAKPRTARQGLIVVAHDTPQIRAALRKQIANGVPVVLLTSSLSGLEGATYIGIDNRMAGRSAARLLSQWVQPSAGQVLLVTNSLLFHAHRQRVEGFMEVLRKRAPTLIVTEPVECHDDDHLTELAVQGVLATGARLAAIYDTGSGSGGIRRALLERQIRPVWIGHEASRQHAELLREGLLSLVLDQDPEGQAQAAIQHLLYVNGDLETPAQVSPQLRIVIDETLPC